MSDLALPNPTNTLLDANRASKRVVNVGRLVRASHNRYDLRILAVLTANDDGTQAAISILSG
jgi:hypothetical protein